MRRINFITSNEFKFKTAQDKLNLSDNIKLFKKNVDCIEIQSNKIEKISSYSAEYAVKKTDAPCIKNDSGLVIPALKDFPGPYTSYIEKTIGMKGILDLMRLAKNRKARFVEVLAFARPGEDAVTFKCVTEGKLSKKNKGNYGWSFDKIFIPKNYDKTFAQFKEAERFNLWDSSGYKKLSDFINELYGKK